MSLSAVDAARVRAWAATLTAGEPVTWAGFRSRDVAPVEADGPVPGTAQLEVLRRLATLHAEQPVPDFAGLASVVLTSSAPGRGLVDPPLPGLASTGAFGVAATEPEELPGNELVRASSGALVRLLLRPHAPSRERRRRRGRRGRRRFVVHGTPLTAAAVRRTLSEHGWVEGGRGAVQLVVARDLESMMAEHWHARARAGAERRWRPLWRRAVTLDAVPPRLRIAATAARLAEEHGSEKVHVLLADARGDVSGALATAVGISRVEPAVPDTEATDLLRRLNPFLVLRGGPASRDAAVAGRWDAALAAVRRPVPPTRLGAPPAMAGWARDAGARMAAGLAGAAAAGDYAVHGDPGLLVPERSWPEARAVDPDRVADLAVRMLATLWTLDPTEGPG